MSNSLIYTESTDILGSKIVTVKNGRAETIAIRKTSTDIFGAESCVITNGKGDKIIEVKETTDIFGNEISTRTTFGDKKATRRFVRLFDALEGRIALQFGVGSDNIEKWSD